MVRVYNNDDSFELYGGEQLAEIVKKNVEWYKRRYEAATEKAARDKEAIRQEVLNEYAEENARLREELALSYGSFTYEEEKQRYDEFCKEHVECRRNSRISFGRIPYVIATGTGIGVGYDVVCPVCGAKKDITEVARW